MKPLSTRPYSCEPVRGEVNKGFGFWGYDSVSGLYRNTSMILVSFTVSMM